MTTGTKTILICGATCGLVALASRAPAQEEAQMNYRCETARMQADAAELRCMDRCQRKAGKQSTDEQAQFFAVCADDCHQRCEQRKANVEKSVKCAASVSASNPQQCAAKHLNALAQLNNCLSGCPATLPAEGEQAGAAEDEPTCQQRCDERYTTAHDRISASDMCVLGGAPVCVYQ